MPQTSIVSVSTMQHSFMPQVYSCPAGSTAAYIFFVLIDNKKDLGKKIEVSGCISQIDHHIFLL